LSQEHKYEYFFQQKASAKGWWIRKLHGNIYQTGLPDLLLARPNDGQLILAEFKGSAKERSLYEAIEIIELMKGPQVGNVLVLSKMRAKVCLILGTPKGYFLVTAFNDPHRKIYPLSVEALIEDLKTF